MMYCFSSSFCYNHAGSLPTLWVVVFRVWGVGGGGEGGGGGADWEKERVRSPRVYEGRRHRYFHLINYSCC